MKVIDIFIERVTLMGPFLRFYERPRFIILVDVTNKYSIMGD